MDPAQARDHIEMVEQIIAESSQRLCSGGEYFVVWGLYSGTLTLTLQLYRDHVVPIQALLLNVVFFLAALAFQILHARATRAQAPRRSLLQREFLNVLFLSLGLAFVANLGGFNLFSGWGQAAIWSFAEAIVLFFIGIHGNRRAQLAGAAVVVSIVAANFTDASLSGYILAAGMYVGYTGFGVAELLAPE